MPNWFQSRQARAGGYSGAYVLVFIAILAALNYLGVQYNQSLDATEDKLYSLSDQTQKILGDLPQDVKIHYFNRKAEFDQPSPQGVSPRASLTRYENASTRLTVEYVDPDSDPAKAELMRVRSYGTVFVESGGRREEANSTSEQDISNAIIKLLKGEEKTACILSGHGEASTQDFQPMGFSVAEQAIKDANYATQAISLLESPEVPPACDVLIVPGPSDPLLEPEVEIIRAFVERGGRLLAMLDLGKSPGLVAMVSGWGIEVDDNLILDRSGAGFLLGGGPVIPLAARYEPHPITEPLSSSGSARPTLFPLVRAVRAGDAPSGWDISELIASSTSSEAIEDYENEEALSSPEGGSSGPFNMAVAGILDVPDSETPSSNPDAAAEISAREELEARVVVVGTSRFSRNSYVDRAGNRDLFLNMINWLTSDEDLISIRPKNPASTPIDMTGSELTRVLLALVFGIPLIIIVAGVRTWWIRR